MQIIDHDRQEEISCTTIMPTRLIPDMVEDVRKSLLTPPHRLSPKYFYDEQGSGLFDQICSTPEYYLTRTENQLLKQYSVDIIGKTRPAQILELGSGYSVKTRLLFDACEKIDHRCIYSPFDVCKAVLIDSASKLTSEYEWLDLKPLLGDYHGGLGNLPDPAGRRLFVFLGSTIGNFDQDEALCFIREINAVMQTGDHLLLGVDRVKASTVLNAAYNDAQGITAKFNLNILHVLNRELDANFDVDGFTHSAGFNIEKSRIEMRLVANANQHVQIKHLDASVHFKQGDDILTEISQKYTYEGIEDMLSAADLMVCDHHEDSGACFSLILAEK